MKNQAGGLDAVRLYLQKRIDRSNARVAASRKAAVAKQGRGSRRRRPAADADAAARRAYRDALRALESVSADSGGGRAALRMAAEEVERVKSALAKIYEVSRHANHDIADAADWGIVEGEAQTALNIVHEAERSR